MDERCPRCGFAEEEYATADDRRWLASVTTPFARYVFEDLGEDAVVAGARSAEALADEMSAAIRARRTHEAVHLGIEAARAGCALAARRPGGPGRLDQINTSDGGVPKRPVAVAEVGFRGVVGDRQESRRHHGHAWQALCCYSSEVLAALAAEGHPIAAGYAGENLTLAGLDWAALRPGVELCIGELRAIVTVPAVPCSQNAGWFADRRFTRIDHDRHPGQARWYAAVLAPGQVRAGDVVSVIAPG